MAILKKKLDAGQYNLKDQVVAINRVTKVVKGGKNMSFAALVVVGDPGAGVVGYGSGKAKEVPQAIRKGIEAAKKNLFRINLTETTIPHQVLGRYGSGHVLLKPAPEGTGVIVIRVLAGGALSGSEERHAIASPPPEPIGSAMNYNADIARARRLMPLVTEGFAANLTEAATRFAITEPSVSTILVGIATPQQFEDALAAVLKGPLPPAALERLTSLRQGFAGEPR